jgi:Holliday junction resolvase RusA-like endonuclease
VDPVTKLDLDVALGKKLAELSTKYGPASPASRLKLWDDPVLVVDIPGEPRGNPRPRKASIIEDGRVIGSRVHEDPKALDWKGRAQVHIRAAMSEAGLEILDGLVAIQLLAWKACPRSIWLKTSQRPEVFSGQKPDLDNIGKLFMDAANGLLWHDDRQVAREDLVKLRAEQGQAPRMIARVHRLPDIPHWPL